MHAGCRSTAGVSIRDAGYRPDRRARVRRWAPGRAGRYAACGDGSSAQVRPTALSRLADSGDGSADAGVRAAACRGGQSGRVRVDPVRAAYSGNAGGPANAGGCRCQHGRTGRSGDDHAHQHQGDAGLVDLCADGLHADAVRPGCLGHGFAASSGALALQGTCVSGCRGCRAARHAAAIDTQYPGARCAGAVFWRAGRRRHDAGRKHGLARAAASANACARHRGAGRYRRAGPGATRQWTGDPPERLVVARALAGSVRGVVCLFRSAPVFCTVGRPRCRRARFRLADRRGTGVWTAVPAAMPDHRRTAEPSGAQPLSMVLWRIVS